MYEGGFTQLKITACFSLTEKSDDEKGSMTLSFSLSLVTSTESVLQSYCSSDESHTDWSIVKWIRIESRCKLCQHRLQENWTRKNLVVKGLPLCSDIESWISCVSNNFRLTFRWQTPQKERHFTQSRFRLAVNQCILMCVIKCAGVRVLRCFSIYQIRPSNCNEISSFQILVLCSFFSHIRTC